MGGNTLFTVGHSLRTTEDFIELLRLNGVTAIADVRSSPYSGRAPQFNQDVLRERLRDAGIVYVFLGEELGARRKEPSCYVDGKARYDLIEREPLFQSGLNRIRRGVERYTIAMLCAEKDPVTCHRAILVARALRSELPIRHIVARGTVETQQEMEERLLKIWGGSGQDLFQSHEERVEDAYRCQAEEIAYVVPTAAPADRSIGHD
jgi:uncharacterized protein (DUF488 family)